MTNQFNIPQCFVDAINSNNKHEFNEKRFSVTELLAPSNLIRICRKYHPEEDARDKLIALLGTSFHAYMEKFGTHPEMEISLELNNGYTLTGIIDDLNEESNLISDYKTSSVSKVKQKDFADYEKQIKTYAYMCYKKGILITHGCVYVLMKDWKKIMLTKDNNYPVSPIYVHEFDITTNDLLAIENFIYTKIDEVLNGDNLCDDEDRWYTGDTFAVYKNENDVRALKVFDSEDEAKDFAEAKQGFMKKREGTYMRCDNYCIGRSYCERYRNK